MNADAKKQLTINSGSVGNISVVIFDQIKKTVTLFLPGFDKSKIKLSQYYSRIGFRTCFFIQSQDPTAEHLFG